MLVSAFFMSLHYGKQQRRKKSSTGNYGEAEAGTMVVVEYTTSVCYVRRHSISTGTNRHEPRSSSYIQRYRNSGIYCNHKRKGSILSRFILCVHQPHYCRQSTGA